MKQLITIALLALSMNAFGAEEMCGVTVQNDNIQQSQGQQVNFIKFLMEHEHATVKECFNERGAVLVGIYPNGEVRAVTF